MDTLRQRLNLIRRRLSFSDVFFGIVFARNWSLTSGLCVFDCSDQSSRYRFAESLPITSLTYPNSNRYVVSGGGLISYCLDNHVIYRVARLAYGVKCTREFKHDNPEHQQRWRSAFSNPSGGGGLLTHWVPSYPIEGGRDYYQGSHAPVTGGVGNEGFTGPGSSPGVRSRMRSPTGNDHHLMRNWGLG